MVLSLLINQPDDWHLHLRDAEVLKNTVPASARHFARALVMPNLKPALTTAASLMAYRQRILEQVPSTKSFTPYMTFYLNESVSPEDLLAAKENPWILGAKLYPAGATTNSDSGAKSCQAIYPLLAVMEEAGLVLQIHGEATHGDIFKRESLFLHEELEAIIKNFPRLRIVLEHISTREAVDFILQAPERVAATITPHHMLFNRNHLLSGGIRPHYYCLPILKKETDQNALQQAAWSANPKFFAGTDSAPHALDQKQSACGCAGIYSAPYALSFYAQIFADGQQLDKLNDFVSGFGADFYQLPRNTSQVELRKMDQTVPDNLPFGQSLVVPMGAGSVLPWSVHEES